MCHTVFISTTSDEDFSEIESDDFGICQPRDETDGEALQLLAYPHRWYLESQYGGCSCHFRHALAGAGFAPVEDWCPEDTDDIEATGHFYDLLQRVLAEGHQLDVVDLWNGAAEEEVRTIDVELSTVPRDHFRFLNGFRLELRP